MTTPNTTGPSGEARELAESLFTNGSGNKAERLVLWQDTTQRDLGGWCRLAVADRIDAALARARDEARREALEEAAYRCDALAQRAVGSRDLEAKFQSDNGYSNRPLLAMFTDQNEAFTEAASEIRALLTPTPQGETKEQS